VIERAELAAQRGSSGVVGLATGHRDLDRLLMGLDPGSLGVVGARPSMGKTSFAAGVASWNVLRDVPSLFVSCEMGAVEIGVRLVGQVSDLGSEALKTGRLSPGQWERLRRMKDAFASAPLEIMDAGAPTPAAIRLRARAMQAKRGLGLVVVDYLGLLTPPAKRDRNDLRWATPPRRSRRWPVTLVASWSS
jgi:replicative DNA helicase